LPDNRSELRDKGPVDAEDRLFVGHFGGCEGV